jgi:hypothetical protein
MIPTDGNIYLKMTWLYHSIHKSEVDKKMEYSEGIKIQRELRFEMMNLIVWNSMNKLSFY